MVSVGKENRNAGLVAWFLDTWPGRTVLAVLCWTAIACVFALPAISNGFPWRAALVGSLAQWWSWGLVAPVIAAVDRRLPLSPSQLPRRVAAHLVPSLLFTFAYIYVFGAVRALFRTGTWSDLVDPKFLPGVLRGMFLWSWLVYWLIVIAWQVYQYYGRYLSGQLRLERLERQFFEARLNALRMQLDPHFLFNALNTVSSQVERDPRLARAMIEHLGDLLRLSLESKDKQEVPFAEELAFLDHYLAIQKIRFADHLKFQLDIDPDVKYALVPSLFLQPLVENAIRHGISRRASGGIVAVTAKHANNQLEIRVADDGVGLPSGWQLESAPGLGLSVTRQRIAALYPNGQSKFAVLPGANGGTEVQISFPLRLNDENGHGPVFS